MDLVNQFVLPSRQEPPATASSAHAAEHKHRKMVNPLTASLSLEGRLLFAVPKSERLPAH